MKRIYLHLIQKFDLKYDQSFVREIEMLVDHAIDHSSYAIQFWRDVERYGLKEALTYLLGSGEIRNEADVPELSRLVSECEDQVRKELANEEKIVDSSSGP